MKSRLRFSTCLRTASNWHATLQKTIRPQTDSASEILILFYKKLEGVVIGEKFHRHSNYFCKYFIFIKYASCFLKSDGNPQPEVLLKGYFRVASVSLV